MSRTNIPIICRLLVLSCIFALASGGYENLQSLSDCLKGHCSKKNTNSNRSAKNGSADPIEPSKTSVPDRDPGRATQIDPHSGPENPTPGSGNPNSLNSGSFTPPSGNSWAETPAGQQKACVVLPRSEETKGFKWWSPIHEAVYQDNLDVLTCLIEAGSSKTYSSLNLTDENPPVVLAAKSGNLEILKYLLRNGGNVNARDKGGASALHWAAFRGHQDIVKYLVENGASVNAKVAEGTPLNVAAASGNLEVVKYLVEHGSNINDVNAIGDTPINTATTMGYLEIVKYLVERGGSINYRDFNGNPAVLIAAWSNQGLDILKYLVKKGASISTMNSWSETLPHIALMTKNTPLLKWVLEQGAPVDTKSLYGWTPLQAAAGLGDLDMVKLLVEKGADVNKMKDGDQFTSVHIAAGYGHLSVLKYLVEHGGNLNAWDSEGRTPIQLAMLFRNFDVARYLWEKEFPVDGQNGYHPWIQPQQTPYGQTSPVPIINLYQFNSRQQSANSVGF